MLKRYFKEVDKKFIKKTLKTGKSSGEKTAGKKAVPNKGADVSVDAKIIKEYFAKIISQRFVIDAVRPVSSSGFSPDGADLIIYENYCEDLLKLFNGSVPQELVYASIFITKKLDKKSLHEVLNRVASVKKINYFSAADEPKEAPIPAFVISSGSSIPLPELKNDIINYYMTNNIEFSHETDVLMIMDTGMVIKNWREKRSFIGLETGEDSMMWFYVLLNEYLDVDRGTALDLRKYIKDDVVYPEY
ncbi:MAG TPA: hypothetical protein PK926_11295 [Spirochaetota bacterium]|nr:hypothetical protein [Spirochaetota bacterium]HPI88287.1 hypothetical protein [Spirochaetota bacterium]HPR47751.1 hypothetical protein [Spirochaetota bacterium]